MRVERDRHFDCQPGRCVAPPPRKLAAGRNLGRCIPRRTWWLRTKNAAGRRVSIAFRTEVEAREAARKVEAARVLGVDYAPRAAAAPSVPTFSEVAEEALKLYASTMSPRAATMRNHGDFLKNHLRPYFGSKSVTPANFSVLEMQRFIAAKRGALADTSLRASLPTLRLVLDHACKLGLLATNPLRTRERLWRPKGPEPVEPFTASELRTVLRAARSIDRDAAVLIQVMAQGGLRPGEALALRRRDVDPETGIVSVSGSQGRHGRGPTKNASSVRKVSVLHPVVEDRPDWRPERAGIEARRVLDGLAVLAATAPDPEARLWPFTRVHLARTWQRILKAARVPYRKPHALRHTFASILLSRGAPLLYVQKVGGWKSPQTLLDTYAKWIEEGQDASSAASSDATPRIPDAVNLTR